jgi:hypothetical protein
VNNLLRPLAIVLLTAGCGPPPPAADERGDAATPVPLTAQTAGDPSAAAASYASALFAGEPTDPWSSPGWAEELAIRPGTTSPASVVVTGTALESVTATTAEVIVTTNPPDAQLRVLLVLRSGTWRVRGHG